MSRRIPPQLRRQVWENYMNQPSSATGPCFVCSTTIHILNFECGHVVSYENGGPTTLENLRPICSSCNRSMGTMNLHEYKQFYFGNPKSTIVPPKPRKSKGSKGSKGTTESKGSIGSKGSTESVGSIESKRSIGSKGSIESKKSLTPENPKKSQISSNPGLPIVLSQPQKSKNTGLFGLIQEIANWTLSESGGCQHRLIKGPRKGQNCGKPISSKKYCKKHLDKYF